MTTQRRPTPRPGDSRLIAMSHQPCSGPSSHGWPALTRPLSALADAIGRHPPPSELLDLLKRLGKCYQRQGKMKEAIATWTGIADKFPGDRRVLAELAELLGDEGQFDEAIRRWEQVASLAKQDLHQQLTAQLEIAQLLFRKEKHSEAIDRLRRALDQVEPDSCARETSIAASRSFSPRATTWRARWRFTPSDAVFGPTISILGCS